MGDCNTNQSCSTDKGSCGTDKKPESAECTIAEDMLCLAKSAKHELLKEKMKRALDAKIGKKLDKVAEVAVDAVLACIQHKIEAKQACNDYKDNLFAALKG